MRLHQPSILLFSLLISFTAVNAQELDHLFTKGSPNFGDGFGAGAFLEASIPAARNDKWIFEPNVDFFGNQGHWVFIFPILAGYRHMLSGRTYGFYLQPMAGYTIGSTAIIRRNAAGQPATNANGDTLDQKGHGFTAGLGFGYTFKKLFNDYGIELRYERLFVAGDPDMAILSIRWVYTMSFHKRRDG